MLGKLIKHEWRSVWKILGGVNLFLILYTFAGVLSFHSSIWHSTNSIIEVLLVLASIFYFISIAAIGIIVIAYITVRFYRNIYTDEGYLMHTLPVSQKELIFSKLLIAFIWTAITEIVIFISVVSIALTVLSVKDGMKITNMWSAFFKIIANNSVWFKETFGISVTTGTIFTLIAGIVSIFQSILMIYTAISLGQLLQKHKILGSFLSYIGINAVFQFLQSIIMIPMMFSFDTSATLPEIFASIFPYYYLAIGESIILSILFFFLTEYLMKKKLNLD